MDFYSLSFVDRCNLVNIDANDLIKGTPHLVLGLLWQIIRFLSEEKRKVQEIEPKLELPQDRLVQPDQPGAVSRPCQPARGR